MVAYLNQGTTRKSVRVDASGAFICEQTSFEQGGGHGHPGGGGHGEPGGGGHHGGIPVDSLPAAISVYVTANFSGYTIRHAEYDSLCNNGLVFEVMITPAGFAPPVTLYFDITGSYLMQASGIPFPSLPQAVKDFLATGYQGYFVCELPLKLTLADGTIQYSIKLRHYNSFKNIRVDASGQLICER